MSNTVFLAATLCLSLCSIVTTAQNGSTLDEKAARKLGDSFMADLVANRESDAIQKLHLPREVAAKQYAEMIDHCGRPLDSRVANDGRPVVGQDAEVNGKSKDTLIFLYACKSTRHSGWIFNVGIEAADDGKYRVNVFGCHNPTLQ